MNKSTLGLPNFLREYYADCVEGIVGDWWNERYSRKGDRVDITFNDTYLKTTYDLINYVKSNYKDISEDDVNEAADKIARSVMVVNRKRVYLWEVNEESKTKTVETEEELSSESEEQEESVEEEENTEEVVKEEKPRPDFNFAKTIEDKQELKDYAKSFGFKIDSRKSLPDMMKSFQGKYHSTKSK